MTALIMLGYFPGELGTAAFFAEYSPCLEVRDGMFDGGADLAQRRVELDLVGVEVDAGESLVRDGVDSLDADVAQIGQRGVVGEDLGQAGCGEGVRVVAGAVHRDRANRGEVAVEGGRDLQVHAGYPALAENTSGT